MIEQPARRGDDDVHAAPQGSFLWFIRHAAKDRRHFDAGAACILSHTFFHLQRQFPRWRKHQCSGALGAVEQATHQRQRERRRLAGAGLRQADDVRSLQCQRNCFALDRRRVFVAGLPHGAQQAGVEVQLFERDAGVVGRDLRSDAFGCCFNGVGNSVVFRLGDRCRSLAGGASPSAAARTSGT